MKEVCRLKAGYTLEYTWDEMCPWVNVCNYSMWRQSRLHFAYASDRETHLFFHPPSPNISLLFQCPFSLQSLIYLFGLFTSTTCISYYNICYGTKHFKADGLDADVRWGKTVLHFGRSTSNYLCVFVWFPITQLVCVSVSLSCRVFFIINLRSPIFLSTDTAD